MKLARMNLSVAAALSILSLVGCADHDKKAAPIAAPVAVETSVVSSGQTTQAAATEASTSAVTAAVAKADPKATTPDPKSGKSTKNEGTSLKVKRLVVARNVEGREPKDVGTAFWKGDFDRLYAFVEIANPEKTESHVVVTFIPPGGKAARGNVSLAVGSSPRWRTWATSHAVDEKGTWAAVVSTEDGRELARESFDIL